MKTISLTRGFVATVDDEDYERLADFKWSYMKTKHSNTGYAVRRERESRQQVLMHREIMSFPVHQVDHKNMDGLDNRKVNLRPATGSQNCANQGNRKNNTSGYKGVTWSKSHKKWQAQIRHKYSRIFLGHYSDIEEAARAYDAAAIRLFGEFAKINFKEVSHV
jgi:hypothetical protein